MSQFDHVVIGGTFDRLHAGHKSLIDKALDAGNRISIGVTSDDYCSSKAANVEPFSVRSASLIEYIVKKQASNRASLVEIDDIFGITLKKPDIDAIIVTNKTKPHALLINKKRVRLGLKNIKVITIPYIKGTDGKIISSTRIRNGEIDREGLAYLSAFPKCKIYLPETMRDALKKPLGLLVKNEYSLPEYIKKENRCLITIGDVVSHTVLNVGLEPDLSVIDYKTQRQMTKHKNFPQKKIRNMPGTISRKAVLNLWRILTGKKTGYKRIIISGEEDLLAIPAILFAPLSAVVVYGLANQGIVVIEVDEQIKSVAKSIIEKFKLKI